MNVRDYGVWCKVIVSVSFMQPGLSIANSDVYWFPSTCAQAKDLDGISSELQRFVEFELAGLNTGKVNSVKIYLYRNGEITPFGSGSFCLTYSIANKEIIFY